VIEDAAMAFFDRIGKGDRVTAHRAAAERHRAAAAADRVPLDDGESNQRALP
jgi:hypothetical protein